MEKISNSIPMDNCAPLWTRVILDLADECGYSHTDLVTRLNEDRSHISKITKDLRKEGLILRDKARSWMDPETGIIDGRKENYPYYLTKKLSSARETLLFKPEELEYPYTLGLVFSNSENPIASFIKEKFSPDIKRLLDELKNHHVLPESLKMELVNELNRTIQEEPFYDEQLFQNIALRRGTKEIIIKIVDLRENEKLLFNRLLSEDAFPFLIRKKATIQLFSDFIDCLVREDMYDEIEKFLGSNYINNLIEKDGFFSVYRIIEEHLVHPEVRLAASALLESPAVSKQIKDVFEAEKIRKLEYFAGFTPNRILFEFTKNFKIKYFDFFPEFKEDIMGKFGDFGVSLSKMELKNIDIFDNKDIIGTPLGKMLHYVTPWKDMRLEVLSKFDPLSTVRFYRCNIYKIFSNLYQELRDRNLITPGLQEFLQHDSYLSPLTSYPFNDYEKLIFAPAFNRLFEDVYLLDQADREVLIKRARAIYDNFADLLLDRQRAIMRFVLRGESNETVDVYQVAPLEDLKAEIKAFIFYWNAVSTAFDAVILNLDHIYDRGTGRYHLISDGINFNIIDLEKNNPLLTLHDSEMVMRNGILPREIGSSKAMKNPLEYLRPCKCFGPKREKESNLITFEQIFSDFKSKLAEDVERGMPLKLDW